jgi:hypothetical protein
MNDHENERARELGLKPLPYVSLDIEIRSPHGQPEMSEQQARLEIINQGSEWLAALGEVLACMDVDKVHRLGRSTMALRNYGELIAKIAGCVIAEACEYESQEGKKTQEHAKAQAG